MALVEGVLCEGLPVAPDLLELVCGQALRLGTFHKVHLEAVEDILLLLSHSLAELVRLALGEACERL